VKFFLPPLAAKDFIGGCLISQMAADAAKRNSFRAVKNQKIASDFLIFYRSLKFYLLPIAIGTGGDSTYETAFL
jgi:hypothetical protein